MSDVWVFEIVGVIAVLVIGGLIYEVNREESE
ncbi:hypothetical protein S101395_01144 [Bacillus sonorensis]|uniref:Uncharacterized protein n=1 Tax=Bacillus sonorensis TaxID=119858 RepID=A0ABM6LEN4_9BACI|nr:hypothetical protein S101395_01144 [Bacillus sonorensis]